VVVVDGRPSDGWLMRRLFVYEELVGILVEVVDVAATSNNAVYSAAKIAELRGRLDEAIAVEDAVFSAESERVREGEYESLVRSFARVTAAVDNVGAVVVGRRQRRSDERVKQRRSEAAAKRWRSGVDRHAEVGRVRKLQREALKRLYVPARTEVIVIDGDDSSGDDEEDDDEESSGEDDDSLAEEGDEEVYGVDDDPDSQVDL
jgi:hypothetical protein